jgi:hypothetical protein
MKTKLTIKSNTPDWAGEWTKNETEAEMNELDIGGNRRLCWIVYVLDHVFDTRTVDVDGLKTVLSTWDGSVTLRDAQGDYAEIILN